MWDKHQHNNQGTLYVHAKALCTYTTTANSTVNATYTAPLTLYLVAAVVLQNCNIYARKPMSQQFITVTAQLRSDPSETSGIIIHNSSIAPALDLRLVQGSFRDYLGSPWRLYSRTVVMKNNIDGFVDPAGWFPWNGSVGLSTLYYGEYMNYGGGPATGRRVKWPGYYVITSAIEAGDFSVGNFLAGESWIPGTGVRLDITHLEKKVQTSHTNKQSTSDQTKRVTFSIRGS